MSEKVQELSYPEKIELCNMMRLHRMKWGNLRYQKNCGLFGALTEEGKKRYFENDGKEDQSQAEKG